MKGIRLIGLVIVVLGLLVAASAAPALAHGPDDNSTAGYTGVYLDSPTLIRLAQTLGLTPDELSSNLQSGETLAEVAQEQNVPEEQLVEAIVAPYADQLALRVRYGYITQEQADALLTEARGHARTLINQDLSGSGEGGDYSWQDMQEDCRQMMGGWGDGSGGWGGMMGHGGMMGDWGQSFSRGWNNMMNGFGGMMKGFGGWSGGMMGGW